MKFLVLLLFIIFNLNYSFAEGIKFERLGSMLKSSPETNPPNFIKGKIYYPKKSKKEYPIVLFLHSTAGLEYRAKKMREMFLDNDIAFLEIDMFGSRKTKAGYKNRLKLVRNYLPDVYGALNWINSNEKINKKKIAIVGQSMGGILALNVALGLHPWMFSYNWDQLMPSAVVAWYPVCSSFNNDENLYKRLVDNSEIRNKPILNTSIITPSNDAYEKTKFECVEFYKKFFPKENIDLVWTVENSTHGFDGNPKKKEVKNYDISQRILGRLNDKEFSLQINEPSKADLYRKKTLEYILTSFKE